MTTVSGLPPIPTYVSISKNEAADIATFDRSDPQTKSNIAYLQKVAPTLTTVNAFLGNYRALSIVLDAFGMSANVNQTALIRQLITQDPTGSTSLAVKSANPNFQRFAQAMNQWSTPPFSNATNVNAVITAIGTNGYENSTDNLVSGMSDALYFTRQASSITNVNQILADPRLLNVVSAASNLPSQFGTMDYTQQVAMLTRQVNLAQFQKPAGVATYVEKYLANSTANAAGATDQASAALAILTGGATADILSSLYPGTSGTIDLLSTLYPNASSSSSDPLLSLFA